MAEDRRGVRETMAHETYRRASPKGDSLLWILGDEDQPVEGMTWRDPRTPPRGSDDG